MIFSNVFSREAGLQGHARLQLFDSIFTRFMCRQCDEQLVEPSSPSCPGLACSFSKVHLDHIAIVDEEGGIRIVDTQQTGAKANLTSWLAHDNAIFDVDWMPGESQLLTASGDKTIVLWDLPEEKKLATFQGHVCSVKTAKFQTDSKDIFVSGSRDGHVMVWDKRTGQKVFDIPDAHRTAVGKQKSVRVRNESPSSQLAVTGVLFQKADTFISVGGTDGVAKVWDLRKGSSGKSQPLPKYTLSCKSSGPRTHGLSSLIMDSRCSRLFVSSMCSIIYQFDCINYKPQPVAQFSGHEHSSFYIKAALSPDDSYLVSGSSDQNAYIWSVDEPKTAPVVLKGQTAEVSAVAWCPNDVTRIVTVNDAGSFWIWRINDYSSQQLNDDVALHVIGQSERKVIQKPSGLRTPRKVLLPRNSPGKVLSSNPTSLQNLPKTSLTSKKLIPSPSILNYFGKSPATAILERPMFTKSPRKLVLSPSKALKVTGNTEAAPTVRHPSAKRKLCTDDDDLDGHGDILVNSKRPKTLKIGRTDAENSSFSNNPPFTGFAKEQIGRVLSPTKMNISHSDSTHPTDRIIKESSADEKQMLSASNCADKTQLPPQFYPTPTYNLPNSSTISRSCTPTRQNQTNKPKATDWLTQMRIDRQKQNDTTATPCRTPNKAPNRTPGKAPSRTACRTPMQKVSSNTKPASQTRNSCKGKARK